MVDRFNNPLAKPKHLPFDDPSFADYQGGKFSGVQAQFEHAAGIPKSAHYHRHHNRGPRRGCGSHSALQ